MVKAVYTFRRGSFELKTLSSNDIVISGATGSLKARDDELTLNYQRRYILDPDTNTGRWEYDTKVMKIKYKIQDDVMTYSPVDSEYSMELKRASVD